MILTSTDIQKYVPQQVSSFNFEKYSGFETRVIYKHFPLFLGDDLIEIIVGEDPDETLLAKFIPVLANLVVLEAVPFFDVVLTSSGFGVVSNTNVAPASRERVAAFAAACLSAANDFMDILLAYLENNSESFDAWNDSSLNPGSLITDTTVFNAHTKLNLKRHQFVDIKQNILSIENTVFVSALSQQFLTELQAGSDTLVKPVLQKALAFLAYDEFLTQHSHDNNGGFKSKGAMFMARAMSLLTSNVATYTTFATYGYEAPYDNDDDDNLDSGVFIAGCTC
jgi:hypothetical protein